MVVVKKEPGGKNVRRSKVHLGFDKIAAPRQMIGICVGWKPLNVDLVVFHFKPIKEPRAVPNDWSGKSDAGNKFIEAQSVVLAERREKVGGIKTEFVFAHPGVEGDDTAGGFTEFHRITGGFRIDRTNCIRADAHSKLAADGRANVESIKQIKRGIGFRPGNMDLTCSILHHARSEGKEVANVARGWVRDVDDFRRMEGAFV